MKLRSLLVSAALAVSAITASGAPVLLMQAVGGVDLNNLMLGQTFQVAILVHGDTPGEVDAGGSGNGDVTDGSPFLNLTAVTFGTVSQGADWFTDPTLFVLDFTAAQVGTDVLTSQGQCLNSNLQNYGCNFGSGPLSFTVRDPNHLPEPGSLALAGMTLLGLAAFSRRRA